MKNKALSTVRVTLSTAAIIVFLFYVLLDKIVFHEYQYTYWWRMGIWNDLLLFCPYLLLLVFALMERKDDVNKRNFVIWIFAIQLIQFLFTLFGSTSQFLLFCSVEFKYLPGIFYAIIGIRIILLFITPFVKGDFLKWYCFGMIGIHGLLLYSQAHYAIQWDESIVENCFPLLPDLMFHIAFCSFSNLLTEDNKTSLYRLLSDGFWGMWDDFSFYDDDDWDDWDDWDEMEFEEEIERRIEEKKKEVIVNVAEQYERVATWALITESQKFSEINRFFENLSRYVFTEDGKYYTTEMFKEKIEQLKELAAEIEKEEEGYISKGFVEYLDKILSEEREEVFKVKVVILAKEFRYVC